MSRYIYGILEGVIPNGGGWRFPYPKELSERLADPFIRADSFQSLIGKVRVFRIEGGHDIGDVEFDVAEYIKAVSPANDRYKGKRKFEPSIEGRKEYRPPIKRITEWLVGMSRKRDLRMLNDFDAAERVPACAKCPHNIEWRTKCAPCVSDVEFRSKNLRGRPIFAPDDKLGACRLHDVLLNAAVFLDQDHLPTRHNEAPADCFMPIR